jgi:hypothetical protein
VPVLAIALHLSLCDWHYKARLSFFSSTGDSHILMRSTIWARTERDPTSIAIVTTGLTTGLWIDRGTAVVWGVFVPLTMIAGDICWLLGWRRRSRLAAGCCAACGYDLRAATSDKCPECGTSTASRKS